MLGIMLNHPSTIWTRQCAENYDYLLELWVNLCYEFEYRYGKKHATLDRLKYLTNRPKNITINNSMTEMPQCMPDYCKVQNNPIQAYKVLLYKREEKICNLEKKTDSKLVC